MTYKMYIDDVRPKPPGDWEVCRSISEVEQTIAAKGMPCFASFDHDLGEEGVCPNGLQVAKMMVSIAEVCPFPTEFDFTVHSSNPCGAANIESYLLSYFRSI